MNATFEELLSKVSTATKNGNAISKAYEKAMKAGLEDDEFGDCINKILSLLEEFTIEAEHAREMEAKLRHQSTKTHPTFIRDVMKAEDIAKSAVRKSTTARVRMEATVARAYERKKARDDAALERQKAEKEKAGAVGSSA
ncbi:unnamed protein product [Microthlaspi erraticum]|uniref:Uncharacterized protein n=1 Tax=Microthlaspi erraticum TaxID=1685480 RepID=A0A6D2I8Z6_9BRAS|nr:unnamed protein product [Microthlaspi erraticum]